MLRRSAVGAGAEMPYMPNCGVLRHRHPIFHAAAAKIAIMARQSSRRNGPNHLRRQAPSADASLGSCAVAPDSLALAAGDDGGHVHILRLENVTPGPPICTAWRSPDSCAPAFGCLHCRVWSEVTEAALGTELPCPNCGKRVKLNAFVIKADWRPVAAAWRGDIPPSSGD